MKRVLICLILCSLCFYCYARPQETVKEKSDTTVVEKTIDRLVDLLNTRNFSEDIEKLKGDVKEFSEDTENLKEDVKEFTDKTKKYIEKYTPKVKKLFKEIGDYLSR